MSNTPMHSEVNIQNSDKGAELAAAIELHNLIAEPNKKITLDANGGRNARSASTSNEKAKVIVKDYNSARALSGLLEGYASDTEIGEHNLDDSDSSVGRLARTAFVVKAEITSEALDQFKAAAVQGVADAVKSQTNSVEKMKLLASALTLKGEAAKKGAALNRDDLKQAVGKAQNAARKVFADTQTGVVTMVGTDLSFLQGLATDLGLNKIKSISTYQPLSNPERIFNATNKINTFRLDIPVEGADQKIDALAAKRLGSDFLDIAAVRKK